MKPLMILDTGHAGLFFFLAYLAAFLTAAGIMIFQGLKNGYPLSSWLLILITGVVFFILGDKIVTYTSFQWHTVFTEFRFPVADEKNALGGVIGLLAGIFLARQFLRFNRPVFDNLAIALPVALAISRVGCLMAGCCFGIPTTLPVGIKYDAGSMVFHSQLAKGLIGIHEHGTLAIHPVQLYQLIGCLLIAFVVWRTRNSWRSGGSMFLFSMLCYGFLRFMTEFLVDPASNSFAGELLWGMNLVQWIVVMTFFPGLIVLILKELKAKAETAKSLPARVTEFRKVILTSLLGVVIILGRNWFDVIEFSTIVLFYIPFVILLFAEIYRNHSLYGARWALPGILVCCIAFMSQKSNTEPKGEEPVIFTDVGLIGLVGSYYENVSRVTVNSGSGCSNNKFTDLGPSKRSLWQGGLDVSYNKWTGKYRKMAFGARAFLGSESGEYTTAYPHSGLTIGVSPYISMNWYYIGFGAGISVGQMKMPIGGGRNEDLYNVGDLITSDYNNIYFFPSVSLRLGPPDILFAEGSFPGLFPSSAPYPMFKAGIGSGFGKTDGTKAVVGYCDGFYAQVALPIQHTVVLEAMYADNFQQGEKAKKMASFGIHLIIPSEKKP
jgi:phosphatidylglycerol:prolipoprotein diacylglycerol transferase